MIHFSPGEFRCKCGCGTVYVTQQLTDKIDAARAIAGVPFKVNSGYRCPAHNSTIKGSPTSSHMAGEAVDIACTDNHNRDRILMGLREAGFKRIGIYPTFIHADVAKHKQQDVTWLGK